MAHAADGLSRSLVAFDQNSTLVAVVEMSQSTWLVAGVIPGVAREPLKRLVPDADQLLALLARWRSEAERAGCAIRRVVVGYEAGRDGFWLARWLGAQGVEAHVIHATSIAVSREHKRAKSDRLDTRLLKRVLLGWLRGEPDHCRMVAIPTAAAEDAKRPGRERQALTEEATRHVNRLKATLARLGIRGFDPARVKAAAGLAELRTAEDTPIPPLALAEMQRTFERLALVRAQVQAIDAARRDALAAAPATGALAQVRLLGRVVGISAASADVLVHEMFVREFRDRRAVARYPGLTGAPDESGARRREKGLSKAGNARVRRLIVQIAWLFVRHQPDSALVRWYQDRVAAGARKTAMIVALARKLVIALWRLLTQGVVPEGVVMRPAA